LCFKLHPPATDVPIKSHIVGMAMISCMNLKCN
jgi:hypothetical protein